MNSKSMCRAWIFGPVLSLSLALATCSGPVPMGTNANGGSGSGTGSGEGSGAGTGTKINLDPGKTSTAVSTSTEVTEEQNCGITSNVATKQVDLLLILDRSGSMSFAMDQDSQCTTFGGGGGGRRDAAATCQQRWDAMKSALAKVINTSAGTVDWGLKLFSTPKQSECAVSDAVEVAIAPNNAKNLTDAINDTRNNPDSGRTPTRDAVNKGVKYLQTVTGPETKAILLATDGQPNCVEGSADTTIDDVDGATQAIKAAHDAGFKVYILGIGPDKFTTTLNGFADAGGTAVTDAGGSGKNYYAAVSAEELSKQFDTIVSSVASCTFTLASAPKVPDNIAVELFDGNKNQRAPRSTSDGWEYTSADHKTLQLYGSWCDKLMNGTYKKATVLFGCPGQIIP